MFRKNEAAGQHAQGAIGAERTSCRIRSMLKPRTFGLRS
jgi:hypothetical protein